MARTWALLWVALWAVGGCEPVATPHRPFDFRAAPWQDGERAEYTVLAGGTRPQGNRAFGVAAAEGGGWLLTGEYRQQGKTTHTEVAVRADLSPVRTVISETGGEAEQRYEGSYEPARVRLEGSAGEETLERPVDAIDNEALYFYLRALPLAPGYERHFTLVNTAARVSVPLDVEVLDAGQVTVPAGTFETWHLQVRFIDGPIEAWYAKAPPHWLVKRVRTSSRSTFELRAYRPAKESAWVGDPAPVPLPAQAPIEVNAAMLAVQLLVQLPIMGLVPVLLGFLLWRRFKAKLLWWAVGAGAFIASQAVHLPLNWALGLIGAPRGAALLPLPLVGLIAGLSAGLCEEGARYVAMRWAMKKDRSWLSALQYGAGHGGIESMITGGLVGLTLLNVLVAPYSQSLGVPPDQQAALREAAREYWTTPWSFALIAAYERLLAITCHVGMSVLVMRAVLRRNAGYLVLSILVHTLLNAPIVFASSWGTFWLYTYLTVYALAVLGFTLLLRETAPSPASPRLS